LKPILPLTGLLCLLAAACSTATPPPKPDLPLSISPGWSAKAYENSPAPEGLPAGEPPVCWKSEYSGTAGATAGVWVCGYAHGAFDALQRTRDAANRVKFYKGRYLVVVNWNGAARTDLTALVRKLESALPE
jgi:hypothetical protein